MRKLKRVSILGLLIVAIVVALAYALVPSVRVTRARIERNLNAWAEYERMQGIPTQYDLFMGTSAVQD